MQRRIATIVCLTLAGSSSTASAQSTGAQTAVTCASTRERVECAADTSKGVILQRATTPAACILGSSWGYDAGMIWVKNGCAGEFLVGGAAPTTPEPKPTETWGTIEPGEGFLVGRTEQGELSLSLYTLFRYMNQMTSGGTFTDHLGREREIDTRHDIYDHRIMIHFKGWLATQKLIYQVTLWTVNTTDQRRFLAVLGYKFHRKFNLFTGLNGLPGSRTLLGSHPFWLSHDRVMADEFFRPYFTNGVWASGQVLPGLWYTAMVGNSLSALGITAGQLTREFAYSASVWWMPTTHEFGPNGGFDDWEYHEDVATRFGISGTASRENRFAINSQPPDNTTIRLVDSLNLFDTGSLADGVTLEEARYRLLSLDAGLKYRGIFVGAAYFYRRLDDFDADGPLPLSRIVDHGFYLQAAFYPIKKKLELYGATSWVFGDESEGFDTQHEYLGGANWFFTSSRNLRVNAQLIRVNRSPVSSTFGFYVGGQKGMTGSLAVSILF